MKSIFGWLLFCVAAAYAAHLAAKGYDIHDYHTFESLIAQQLYYTGAFLSLAIGFLVVLVCKED